MNCVPSVLPQNPKKVPRHLFARLSFSKQGANHRHRVRARFDHAPRILPRNPSNRNQRLRRPRPRPPHSLQPDHRLRIQLRRRAKHRPHSDIVCAARVGQRHLLLRVRRCPDPPSIPHHTPRILRREISLPYMHPTPPSQYSKIRPIIQNHPAIHSSKHVANCSSSTQNFLWSSSLIPVLKQPHSRRLQLLCEIGHRQTLPPQHASINDRIQPRQGQHR
jgi:hypothetical protein